MIDAGRIRKFIALSLNSDKEMIRNVEARNMKIHLMLATEKIYFVGSSLTKQNRF
jgi:hypothetical protein